MSMARKDAMANMREVLLTRRDALRKALAGDLSTSLEVQDVHHAHQLILGVRRRKEVDALEVYPRIFGQQRLNRGRQQ